MANINFKDILNHNGITTPEDILTIDYITDTGRGCFVVSLPDRFPTTAHNMKLFIDMFLKAGNPEETARGLYEYLKKCSDFLTDFRNRIEGINDTEKKDRAALTAAIKKYTANIETLCKTFNFDAVQDENAIKMQKTEVVTVIYDRAKNAPVAVNKTGYRFTKAGRVFHVYKENKTVFVIVPEVGQAVATYTGDIKTAPEYITALLLEKLAKIDLIPLYNKLMDIIKESDNIILNNDIKSPATPEEKEPAPAAVPEVDQTATAPTEANQEPETARPEPVKDPDINNAINIYDNDDKYIIIAAPHGRYDVICQDTYSYFTMSITVNNSGVIERYYNGTRTYYKDKYFKNEGVTLLYDLYKRLLTLGLLPEYKPSDTTRDNIKGIYNRHNPAPASYTMQLYKVILYYRLFTDQARPEKAHNGIIYNSGINDHRRQKAAFMKPYGTPKRHNITPGYTEVVQDPGPVRSRYGITTALYDRITVAPPGIRTAYRANIPPYYNTS